MKDATVSIQCTAGRPSKHRRAARVWCVVLLCSATGYLDCASAAQGDPRLDLSSRAERAAQEHATMLSVAQLDAIEIDPQLREYVRQLEDPSFVVREQASRYLQEAATDKLQLYALLEDKNLTTEQRYRLLSVVRERLLLTPRGALGISMEAGRNVLQPVEVKVADLIPGLPAQRVLRIGDRITHIDGQPLMNSEDLTFRVQSKKPGEKVRLTVKRSRVNEVGDLMLDANNQPLTDVIDVELELGSTDILDRMPSRNRNMQLQEQRAQEAAKAAEIYAPIAQPIRLHGGPEAVLALQRRAQLDVDSDTQIQNLLLQRRLIADGRFPLDKLDVVREGWTSTLLEMQHQLQSPNLTAQQRQYLQRVINRYIELMQIE